MKHLLILSSILIFGLVLYSACDQDDDVDEVDYGDYQPFLDAIPSPESLELSLPQPPKSGKGLGELASFYDMTVDFTRDVNASVQMFLSWIDEIVSYPPSDLEGETYIWGPWSGGGLSPVEMRFDMSRTEEGRYAYHLKQRPKESSDDWTIIWDGVVKAHRETARRGTGTFSVDFTAARLLDPTMNESGRVEVVYDTITDGKEIEVAYIDFTNHEEDPDHPVNGEYFYHNHADDTGSFVFDWEHDIHQEQYSGEQYGQLEHSWFNTRWQSNGAGRSDVVVDGGDLSQFDINDKPIQAYEFSECWGSDFLRGYYIMSARLPGGELFPIETEGEQGVCVFDGSPPK